MKHLQLILLLCLFLWAVLPACKKDSDKLEKTRDPLTGISGCIPLADTVSVFGTKIINEYVRDAGGKLKEINTYTIASNTEASKILTQKKELHYNAEGLLSEYFLKRKINEIENSEGFLIKLFYKKGVTYPEYAEYYRVSGKIVPELLTTFYVTLNNKGQLQQIEENTHSSSTDIEFTYNFEYDLTGNVSKIVIMPDKSNTPFNYEFGDYDTNSTPFAQIPNWLFLNLPIEKTLPLAVGASKNNPRFVNAVQAEYSIRMNYKYNDKGFPISRVDSVEASTGSYREAHGYSYRCE